MSSSSAGFRGSFLHILSWDRLVVRCLPPVLDSGGRSYTYCLGIAWWLGVFLQCWIQGVALTHTVLGSPGG